MASPVNTPTSSSSELSYPDEASVDVAASPSSSTTCSSLKDCHDKLRNMGALQTDGGARASLTTQKTGYEEAISAAETKQDYSLGALFSGGAVAILGVFLLPEITLLGIALLAVGGISGVIQVDKENVARDDTPTRYKQRE